MSKTKAFAIVVTKDEDKQPEIEEFQDMVVGNFQDSYTNLKRKLLMGLRGTIRLCSGVKYVLKADDDFYVQIPRLVNMMIKFFRIRRLPVWEVESLHSTRTEWEAEDSLRGLSDGDLSIIFYRRPIHHIR